MITLKTESNDRYMAFANSALNLKKVVCEYNHLKEKNPGNVCIVINGIELREKEFEEPYAGGPSSLEFFDEVIEMVETGILLSNRLERDEAMLRSEYDKIMANRSTQTQEKTK